MTDIPMPDEIIAWTKANGWGQHHLRWHIERISDATPVPVVVKLPFLGRMSLSVARSVPK
jgi:hypothetical protein